MCSIAGEQVRETWKEVMSAKLSSCELELDLDNMIGTQDNPGYMCRSCFDKFKTFSNMRNELLEKAAEALAEMTTVPLLPTHSLTSGRKRRGDSLQQPPSKRLFSEDDQASPAVVVSSMIGMHTYI